MQHSTAQSHTMTQSLNTKRHAQKWSSPLLVLATNGDQLEPSARPVGSEKQADWRCFSAKPAVPMPATVVRPHKHLVGPAGTASLWEKLDMMSQQCHATTLTAAECRPWQQDLKALLAQTMSDGVHCRSIQGACGHGGSHHAVRLLSKQTWHLPQGSGCRSWQIEGSFSGSLRWGWPTLCLIMLQVQGARMHLTLHGIHSFISRA